MAGSEVELQRSLDPHPSSGNRPALSQTLLDGEVELESLNQPPPHEFSLPPVDRGKDAWLFLAASFVIEALVWGKSLWSLFPSMGS